MARKAAAGARKVAVGASANSECGPWHDKDIQIPEGWTVRSKTRDAKLGRGKHVDRTYVSPRGKHVFYSKKKALEHLATK